jgi:hypothetical protein
MSSSYYILCMSHDPATVVSESSTEQTAIELVGEGFETHPSCDFLVMRVSGAPVEFTCTGDTAACLHSHEQTADADWLRVMQKLEELASAETEIMRRRHTLKCWSKERMHRLRSRL